MRLVRRLLGRPVVAFVVLGLGVFCLALSILIPSYVLPRVELMPLGEETTSVSTGPGSYFDENTLQKVGPVPMTVTTHVVGDVNAGQQTGYAVWNISTRIDTPKTLNQPDPRFAYSWNVQHVVSERHTGAIVNCCGAIPPVHIDVHSLPYPFVYLQFPYSVAKTTYDYWDSETGKAYPILFSGTTTVDGHELYRFTGTVPATTVSSADVPGQLIGLPNKPTPYHVNVTYRDDGIDILVDPTTGAPVRTTVNPITTFRLPGSTEDRLTLLAAKYTTSPASEQAVLATAISGGNQLRMLQYTLPNGLRWIGIVLVLGGIGLVILYARRSRRSSRAAATTAAVAT